MEETHSSAAPAAPLRLEKIAAIVLMATAFITPIFFIPSGLFSVPFAKSIVLYIGVILSFILFLFSMLESGVVKIFKSPIFYLGFAIPVLFLVSSLSSSSVMTSLSGYGVEVGTFSFVLLMYLMMCLVPALYRTKERIFYTYLLYFLSFGIVALYQTLRLIFGPNFLSFGLMTTSASNLVGSWNDLGVFFAIAALLAVMTLEMLSLSRLFKWLLYVSLVLSLLFVSIVNFLTLWYILAAFSLVFLLFLMFSRRERHSSEGHEAHGRRLSYLSIALFVLSLIFIFAGSFLGNGIANALHVANLEVRPSWSTTWSVARQSLSHNILLGSGPNTFQYDWVKYKPAAINSTAFWSTDFMYGIGLIPTFLATSGILGFLAWIGLLAMLVYTGVRTIFMEQHDSLSRYFVVSSFIASLCLWATLIFYVPSMAMVAITFLFTGLFIASVANLGLLGHKTIHLYNNARTGFTAVLVTVFALLLAIAGGYFMTRNFVSTGYFQKSVQEASANNITGAEADMTNAINLRGFDIYYRSLAEIQMVKLNAVLNQPASSTSADALRQQFQTTLGSAIQSGLNAVTADPANYQNYIELGQIYEAVVPPPFQIDGAYDKAKEEYQKAIALNPQGPEPRLLAGRLEMAKGNTDAARTAINEAIQLKPDYVDAFYLLAQVEATAGNLDKAISSAQSATYLAPDNAGVYFQLGLLKYDNNDFSGASQAFEQALKIVPNYANAQYFLGLSYAKLNRTDDAIKQFEAVAASNPDNAEVKTILSNLRAGLAPLANLSASEQEPQKRDTPPIKQDQ